ncbi:MAG: hypothetical protein GY873_29270 [Bosea sp.]|uniref:hypothetical protein n=1 Tax=Bosea sp. (in: a-proteobacteria) TaxID=1871050 RepID=UPI002388F6B6|nr:hypothetical protein [Bosea sp. (in: a-proteobacteria)]MCP4738287.1 hypothetical protein [Bosea sp. (in: a-proteobacteria)]
MSNDNKPAVERRDEEEAFLTPPGQPGSLVDKLAAAQLCLPGLEPNGIQVQLELFARVVVRGDRND